MAGNKLIDKLDNDNIPLFSVSEITREITDLLEYRYSYIKVKGEISQETGDKYPEIYFTLKDEENVISGIIKRNKVPQLKFLPEVGLEVICTGKITAWTKKDSKFQIDVDSISVAGEGQLLKMKEELSKKLQLEGLYDHKHKKEIPFIPNKIGMITSKSGSVIEDMQRIINERFPVPIELFSVRVQGENAVKGIIDGIKYFNNQSYNLKVDVLIIARGGGSIEDLWCFNNEDLVRSVFNSEIPVISAIGHETDTNIIDLVADITCATPSHAAVQVVPERKELLVRIKNNFKILEDNFFNFFSSKIKNLDYCFGKLKAPDILFNSATDTFCKLKIKFINSEKKFFSLLDDKLKNEVGKLEIGSHQNTLKRGYTYIKNLKNNLFIKSVKDIKDKTNLKITFHDGTIKAISKKKQ